MSSPAPTSRPSASGKPPRTIRRLLQANLLASVLLALALLLMLLYLFSRHYLLLRTPSAADRPLAEKTTRLLSSLSDDLNIYALVRPTSPAAEPLRRLLDLYAAASPYVHVRHVDPDRDLALSEQIRRQYSPPDGEVVVVAMSDTSRAIPADSLLVAADALPADSPDADLPPPSAGDAIQHSAFSIQHSPSFPAPSVLFCGESLLSAAIYTLVQPTPPIVYFLTGHGEHLPSDFSPDGYSRIAALLRQDNLAVDTLYLPEAKAVPPQAALLVIAGPSSPISSPETALLRDYLSRKGRLLVLLDALASADLDTLLREWGVALDQDAVIDPAHTLDGRNLHVLSYAPDHPVTTSLRNFQTVLHFPRSVRPANPDPAPDDPVATPLLLSGPTAWADVHPLDPAPRFNPQADLPGPVPLALAIERGPIPGLRTEIRPTRLLVIGDSAFAANSSLRAANAALFLNAVNWLIDRPDHLGIPPAPLPPPAATIPAAALRRLFLRLVLLLPLATALLFLLPRLLPRILRRR